MCCLRPALDSGSVELLTNALARRLLLGTDGQIEAVEVERAGTIARYRAHTFVVSCGAVASAALLLRSWCAEYPRGLANSSGLVGANLMLHNSTGMAAIYHFGRRNTSAFQKSINMTDFYFDGPQWPYPLGTIQLVGFMPLGYDGVPGIGRWLSQRSIRLFAMSEDLPDPESRVLCDAGGGICIRYRANNLMTHKRLAKLTRKLFRRSGYSLVVSRLGYESAHVCGTARFGTYPQTSVLDPVCRTHDIANLYVVDASFFPSSAAVNPALTVIARALLDDLDIDVIYNPLPNSRHAEWSIRALQAGKHVLCEKPLAANVAEARAMVEASVGSGRRLVEALHYRYHPLATRMREIVTGGTLGAVRHLEVKLCVYLPVGKDSRFAYETGGGAAMDVGCYAVDACRYLVGSEPSVSAALAVAIVLPRHGRAGNDDGPQSAGAAAVQPHHRARAVGAASGVVAAAAEPARAATQSVRGGAAQWRALADGRERRRRQHGRDRRDLPRCRTARARREVSDGGTY